MFFSNKLLPKGFLFLLNHVFILHVSLQKLQGDVKVAEGNEEHHLQVLREAENLLQGKKTELEGLKDQVRLILSTLDYQCCWFWCNWKLGRVLGSELSCLKLILQDCTVQIRTESLVLALLSRFSTWCLFIWWDPYAFCSSGRSLWQGTVSCMCVAAKITFRCLLC